MENDDKSAIILQQVIYSIELRNVEQEQKRSFSHTYRRRIENPKNLGSKSVGSPPASPSDSSYCVTPGTSEIISCIDCVDNSLYKRTSQPTGERNQGVQINLRIFRE